MPWVVTSLAACGGGRSATVPNVTAAAAEKPSVGADFDKPLPAPALLVPPPRRSRDPDEASRVPLPPWTAAPAGSTVRVFREVLMGMMPARALRNTWWLVYSGQQALLRLETQRSSESIPHLDRTSHSAEVWSAPLRTEYVGRLTRPTPPFTLKLQRRWGEYEPAALVLDCAAKTVPVHPAFATLVEGWKNDDDSMEPGTWAPTRTENVAAIACTLRDADWPLYFGVGLVFAAGKTTVKLETAGIEWAFTNSDMLIQEGGYRFIPRFSLEARVTP